MPHTMHSIFFLTVSSLLLLYLGNDKTVLHFRFVADHPLFACVEQDDGPSSAELALNQSCR